MSHLSVYPFVRVLICPCIHLSVAICPVVNCLVVICLYPLPGDCLIKVKANWGSFNYCLHAHLNFDPITQLFYFNLLNSTTTLYVQHSHSIPPDRIFLCPIKYLVHDLTLAVSKCKRTNKTCGKTKAILRQHVFHTIASPVATHVMELESSNDGRDTMIRDTQSQVGNYLIYCISYYSNVNYYRELKYYELNKNKFNLHAIISLDTERIFRRIANRLLKCAPNKVLIFFNSRIFFAYMNSLIRT